VFSTGRRRGALVFIFLVAVVVTIFFSFRPTPRPDHQINLKEFHGYRLFSQGVPRDDRSYPADAS
jgi:hypothetical protein